MTARSAFIGKWPCPRPFSSKRPDLPGVLIQGSGFVCHLWRANTALRMHPRQSRGASSLDWERGALPIEANLKAPSPDEAFYFQISILSLFSQQDISRCPFLFFAVRFFILRSREPPGCGSSGNEHISVCYLNYIQELYIKSDFEMRLFLAGNRSILFLYARTIFSRL